MFVTDETKATAQQILDYWEEHPEAHDQGTWWGWSTQYIEGIPESESWPNLGAHFNDEDFNVCKTVMCAAGTAVFVKEGLAGLKATYEDDLYGPDSGQAMVNPWTVKAGDYLGLNYEERRALFFYADRHEAKKAMRYIANGDKESFHDLFGLWDYEEATL